MSVNFWKNTPIPENSIDKIKILVWDIITAKIFLDPFFEKYYHNFIDISWNFNMSMLMNCIWEVEKKLMWNNYKIRYSNFEKYIGIISVILQWNENILNELKESIIWDLETILWDNLTSQIENFKNSFTISTVKSGIHSFIEQQFQELQSEIWKWKLSNIRNEFIKKIAKALEKKDETK